MAVSDAFVLPSSETWGVAAIEAVALGVPAIVSDEVGCHPDLIRNERCGTVVTARSLDSLSSAVGRYLGSPVSADEVRRSAEAVMSSFSYDSIRRDFVSGVSRLAGVSER